MILLLRFALLLSIFCWPVLVVSQEAATQEVPPLARKLEKVFEEKEPTWKIERPYFQMNPPVMHLKSDEGDVLIYFWLMDGKLDAQAVFDGEIISLGNTLGSGKKESKLTDFGDDNRLVSDRSGRFAELAFRKDNIFISVAAPSESIAKRFAQYVMDQMLASDREKTQSGK